jgi:thioredoxin-like negative regulator of GroEL
MRPRPSSFLLAALVASAAAACGEPSQPDSAPRAGGKSQVKFVNGYAAGMKQAAASGKPPMFWFTATWCGPCKTFAGSAFTDPENVARLAASVTPVKIDIDEEPETSAKFEIQAVPTIVFADLSGAPLDRMTGVNFQGFKALVAKHSK